MVNCVRHIGVAALTCISLALLTSHSAPAHAWDRGDVQTFAVLPDGAPKIEGLTVGEDGNVYVSTFDPTGTASAQLFVFNTEGRQLRHVTIAGASPATLGLAFHPMTHNLLVIDFGAGNVRMVDPQSGASSICITLSQPPGPAGLNALTFDGQGNIYISDSFQGIIWKKTGAQCGAATIWATDPLLAPNGIPPFGANGLQFNKSGSALFVANTSTDRLIKIPVASNGAAGAAQEFTDSINGADGIVLDPDDNIWVVANQADEIVVVDPTGKAIAKLGDFNGLKNGVTRGLLFPASPGFSKDGKWLFVSNLELDLRSIGGPQTVDSQWAAQVQRHSIAKLRARIPRLPESD